MKVTEMWKLKSKPTVSFELYPARDADAESNLDNAINRLAQLEPDFFSVTFGAGGSTREGSYYLVKKLLKEISIDTVAYFTCYGLSLESITAVLDAYQDLGVENILAARGDAPNEPEDFEPHPESLPHASDLLSFLRPRYDFCLAAAGYPEGHIESESLEQDLAYLKLKADNGADFIITNYFYDNRLFFDFTKKCEKIGIHIPILPGVMPIYSINMMKRLAKMCGASIPARLQEELSRLDPNDKGAVAEFGIDYATRQCRELLQHGVCGIHFYTMDRSKASCEIVTRLRSEGRLS